MPQPADGEADRASGRRATADAALIVLTVLAFACVFTWLGPVLKPFLVAVFLFYVAQFGAEMLGRIGFGPRTAYTGLLGITVILAILFGQLVQRETSIFLGKWPKYEARITRAINSLPHLELWLPKALDAHNRDGIPLREQPTAPVAANATESPPPEPSLGDLFQKFSRTVIDYLLRHTLDAAETFALVLVYLFFLFIGSIVACVPPIVMAFLGLPTSTAAAVLSVLLVVNRLVWIDFIEIRMSGKELNLDPTLMFLWLAYWGWAWGVLGLLLAYPMLASVKIVLAHAKGGAGWAVLLSEE